MHFHLARAPSKDASPTTIYITVSAAARAIVRECVTVHEHDRVEVLIRKATKEKNGGECFGSWWKVITEEEFVRMSTAGECEVVKDIGGVELPRIHAFTRFEGDSDVPCSTYKTVRSLVRDLVSKVHVASCTKNLENRLHKLFKEKNGERFSFMGWSVKEGFVIAVASAEEAPAEPVAAADTVVVTEDVVPEPESASAITEVDEEPSNAGFAIAEVCDGYMLNGVKVRKTLESPVRISVYDVMCAITGHDLKDSTKEFNRICHLHPEVRASWINHRFPGRGQRYTPATDARGLVVIMNCLSGRQAAQFRMKSADVLIRYLGGDQTAISEINVAQEGTVSTDHVSCNHGHRSDKLMLCRHRGRGWLHAERHESTQDRGTAYQDFGLRRHVRHHWSRFQARQHGV
jgi:hypothetical protein